MITSMSEYERRVIDHSDQLTSRQSVPISGIGLELRYSGGLAVYGVMRWASILPTHTEYESNEGHEKFGIMDQN